MLDATQPCPGDVDGDGEGNGVDDLLLAPDDTTPLHAFRQRFSELGREPCSDEAWSRFVALVDEMTAEAAVIVKLPVRMEGRASGKRSAIDLNDAKGIQTLYRRNRRRAVRLILSGEGQSCDVAVQEVEDHFRGVWAPSTCDQSIFPRVDGREPVPMSRSRVPMFRNVSENSRTRHLGTTGSLIGIGKNSTRSARY